MVSLDFIARQAGELDRLEVGHRPVDDFLDLVGDLLKDVLVVTLIETTS